MIFHCDVCGKEMHSRIRYHHHTYCQKHYKQIKKYGHPMDTNPRTVHDLNEFHTDGDVTYIDLYDKNYNVIAKAIIDTEDLEKVRYTKWKFAHGYAMNTPKFKGSNKHMSRVIMDNTNQFVDHINHNTLDNRKCNLRIVTKSQNQMDANYKGVFVMKDGRFYAHIKINGKMFNLGHYVDKEEAYFARWYAETKLFKDYKYPKDEPQILQQRKIEIMAYVDKKVQRL